MREFKPRFVPSHVIIELAVLCKAYRVSEVYGDKYAIGFHADEWRKHGVRFRACERNTSENFLGLLPLLLAKRARLINHATGRTQLANLERSVGASDRESVGHPQHASAHDDVAASIAGVIGILATKGGYDPFFGEGAQEEDKPMDPVEDLRRRCLRLGIPSGWTPSEFELRTRPPMPGLYREAVERDPLLALEKQRIIERRLRELCEKLGIDVKDRDKALP